MKKLTKVLKIVDGESPEDIIAFCSPQKEIYVNIEELWMRTKHTKTFIKQFSKCILHEHIHLLIKDCINNTKRTEYGEERVVRLLCNEKFNKETKKYYRGLDYEKNRIKNRKGRRKLCQRI